MNSLFAILLVVSGYTNSFSQSSNVWGKFEEPINACYATDAGSVSVENGALKVVANQTGSLLSDHVIAQHRLNSTGVDGRIMYRISFYIVADSSNNLTFPETGPEVSVQNTRLINGVFLTSTAALQYVANPWNTHWNVWAETSPGVANWVTFPGPALIPQTWYTLTIKADMNTNTYTSATLCQGSACQVLPVGGVDIAQEQKWNESALWLTAETENLWQPQCGGAGALALSGTVLYDNVTFR